VARVERLALSEVMLDPLLEKFQQCCRERIPERYLTFTQEGLVLGVTTLAKFAGGELHMDEDRVLSLLSVAYGERFLQRTIGYILAAEKAYKCGDNVIASMHLALATPRSNLAWGKPSEHAYRLFCADAMLAKGMRSQRLLKHFSLVKDDSTDSGYDQNTDGSADGSGDYFSGDSSDSSGDS